MTAVVADTMASELAAFAAGSTPAELTAEVRDRIKISLLDSLACGIAGQGGEPVQRLRGYLDELGGHATATLLGGGRTSPDRAAFFNGAAIRYLDYNDTFAAPGESCHPSDNIAPVLAAAEAADASGADVLLAIALAYGVQCRLSLAAPVRAKGFDHTVLGMLGMAVGAARARGLDATRTAHAIAITGTAFNALRVTRTGALSNWKGLAAPNAAFSAVHAVTLAAHGVTGPAQIFEGNKGMIETITGPFEVRWSPEDLSHVLQCSIKKYNAEFHSQSAVEAALRIRNDPRFDVSRIERIDVDTFKAGFHIIGGGEEGDKTTIRTREDADHSLPYIAAVSLLDGDVGPAQYTPEKIASTRVHELLARVHVTLDPDLSERFPHELPCRLRIRQSDGVVLETETSGYHGFFSDPFGWDDACEKFDRLAGALIDHTLRDEIFQRVSDVDELDHVRSLTSLLARVPRPPL